MQMLIAFRKRFRFLSFLFMLAVLSTAETTIAAQSDFSLLASKLLTTPLAKPIEDNKATTNQDNPNDESSSEATEEISWTERLTISGDFRARYEGFYKSGRSTRNQNR